MYRHLLISLAAVALWPFVSAYAEGLGEMRYCDSGEPVPIGCPTVVDGIETVMRKPSLYPYLGHPSDPVFANDVFVSVQMHLRNIAAGSCELAPDDYILSDGLGGISLYSYKGLYAIAKGSPNAFDKRILEKGDYDAVWFAFDIPRLILAQGAHLTLIQSRICGAQLGKPVVFDLGIPSQ